MMNSIGSHGSAMSMWNVSRSTGAQSPSSTEGTRRSPGEELFSKLDGDGSGGLSASELQSFVDKMSSDTRGALLTTQEASTSSTSSTSATSAEDLLTAMDGDGDGSISQSELDAYMKASAPAGGPPPPPPPDDRIGSTAGTDPSSTVFSAIDADGDGSVSQTELADFLAAMKPDTSTSATDDAATTADGTATAAASSSADIASLLTSIDTDGDGSVSQSELDAFMKTQGPPPSPPHGRHAESDASGGATSTSTSSTSSSGDASTSSDTAADLAQQLAAAMAQYAAQAYGRVQTGSEIASLLGAVA